MSALWRVRVWVKRLTCRFMALIEDLGGSGLQRLSASEQKAYALAAQWLRDNPPVPTLEKPNG